MAALSSTGIEETGTTEQGLGETCLVEGYSSGAPSFAFLLAKGGKPRTKIRHVPWETANLNIYATKASFAPSSNSASLGVLLVCPMDHRWPKGSRNCP